jgi:pimeloyl-ACP methyl ester carboxylesterase
MRGGRSDELHVYFEGDGAPWRTLYHPPLDPTPFAPIALALASQDSAPATVYLGRPCQYPEANIHADCPMRYWTSHRFSPEVVSGYQKALDELKRHSGARRFRLFGYSGGGVLATLIAGNRDDVSQLVTISAPLSLAEWTAWHGIGPLSGSMDPVRVLQMPILTPSVHFSGGRDSVVPPAVVTDIVWRLGGRHIVVPAFDHTCCWSRDWRQLLEDHQ